MITSLIGQNLRQMAKWVLQLNLAAAMLAGVPVATAVTVFDANASFLANETPDGAETNPFGAFSAGHSLTPGGFTAFTGAQHTDSFNGNAPIEGYFIPNNVLVPAVIANVSGSTFATNFGATLDAGQILLHPGNTGPDGFPAPHSNAVLRFTAPTAGSYVIAGDFESLDSGSTVNQILHNGVALSTTTADNSVFSMQHTLLAGETIDFVVGANGAIGNDSTGLRAALTLQDAPAPGTTFRAGADLRVFELANDGPNIAPVNGSWRYGTSDSLGSTFNPFSPAEHSDSFAGATNPATFQGWFEPGGDLVPVVAVNVSNASQGSCCGTFDPDQIWMHGEPDGSARTFDIVRWIAPGSGTIDLEAVFEQMHDVPSAVHVLFNGVPGLFSGLATPGVGTIFSTKLNVVAGDIIDFVVGPNPNLGYGATSTGFNATIVYVVPEPATLSLLALGTVLLAGRRRHARV